MFLRVMGIEDLATALLLEFRMAKDKLGEYSAKRKFEATPEPGPVPVVGRRGPLLFVIQQHSATRLHYDLRLECDECSCHGQCRRGLR